MKAVSAWSALGFSVFIQTGPGAEPDITRGDDTHNASQFDDFDPSPKLFKHKDRRAALRAPGPEHLRSAALDEVIDRLKQKVRLHNDMRETTCNIPGFNGSGMWKRVTD